MNEMNFIGRFSRRESPTGFQVRNSRFSDRGHRNQERKTDSKSSLKPDDRSSGIEIRNTKRADLRAAKHSAENSEFEKTYNSVAEQNKKAFQADKEVSKARDDKEFIKGIKAVLQSEKLSELTKKEAVSVIEDALKRLSDDLNLNIVEDLSLSDTDFREADDKLIEQFSDILFFLKKIQSLLSDAGSDKQGLDLNGSIIEPQDAETLSKGIKAELFRLEYSLKTLSLSEEVSEKTNEKLNQMKKGFGIPVALPMSELSMSKEEIKQFSQHIYNQSVTEGDKTSANPVMQRIIQKMSKIASQDEGLSKKEYLDLLGKLEKGSSAADLKRTEYNMQSAHKGLKISNSLLDTASSGEGAEQGLSDKLKPQIKDKENSFPVKGAKSEDKPESKVNLDNLLKNLGKDNLNKENSGLKSMFSENIQDVSAGSQKTGATASNLKGVSFKGFTQSTPETAVLNQITEKVNVAVKNGVHEARMTLRPQSLGEVRIKLQVEEDVVTAKIHVENQQVKQIVEKNLDSLKSALQENSLKPEEFDVNVRQDSERNREDLNKDMASGKRGAESERNGMAEDDEPVVLRWKSDTGRRFGNNSIEYFV